MVHYIRNPRIVLFPFLRYTKNIMQFVTAAQVMGYINRKVFMQRVRTKAEEDSKLNRQFEKKFDSEIFDLYDKKIIMDDFKGKYVIVSHTDFATFFSVLLLVSPIS